MQQIALRLSALTLRGVVEGACRSAGVAPVGEVVLNFLRDRFDDRGRKLSVALENANDRAWTALEGALAGDSWWGKITGMLASADDAATRKQIRAFLDGVTIPDDIDRTECLRELKAVRAAGHLSTRNVTGKALARHADDLARFADPSRVVDAEWHLVEEIADELQPSAPNLCGLLIATRQTSGDLPLIVTLARYFFRRQVEADRELFQTVTFARLESVAQEQRQAFDALDAALTKQGSRILSALAEVQHVVFETHGAVVETRGIVQKIQEDGRHNNQEMNERLGRMERLLVEFVSRSKGKDTKHVRPGDSVTLRDSDRQEGLRLLAQAKSLSQEAHRRDPGLQNAEAKVAFLVEEFETAQRGFQAVAESVTDEVARGEAHASAFAAALERNDFATAMQEYVKAVRIDGKRFATFPVGKYQPQNILGAGGFGVAFLCKHKHMNAQVVVKTLMLEHLGRDADKVFSEAQLLRQLEHPAIIRVSDCGYVDAANKSRPFLVMDYFEGGTLEEYVKKNGAISVEDVLPLCRQVAEGLQAAHGKNILHRDVKPANLLVRKNDTGWRVKVIDFGLALRQNVTQTSMNASTGKQRKTRVGAGMAGTQDFAPPEQMGKRDEPVGPYSDIYGWAKTCCYALFQTTQPLLSHWNSIPRTLAELLETCLHEDPKKRPRSFAEVLTTLSEVQGSSSPQLPNFEFEESERTNDAPATRSLGSDRGEREAKPSQRRKLPFVVVGVALVAAICLVFASEVIFRAKTKVGTLIVEIDQPGAEVFVDGNRYTITPADGKEPIQIEVHEGKGLLKVVKGGFETYTLEFSIKSGGREVIRARLEPIKTKEPPKLVEKNGITANTLAYYRFEEGAGTKVINSVDGAVDGTHNALYTREPPVSKIPLTGNDDKFGLEFTGKEVVTIGTPFVFHRGGDGTLEFWVNVRQGDRTLFWSSPVGDDTNRFHIGVAAGSLFCDYRDASGELHTLLVPGNDFVVPADTWTHIAITRSGITYRFYKDGNAVYTIADGKPVAPTTVGWKIGGKSCSIDEVRLSNKALLPAEFLNASLSSKKKDKLTNPTTVGYYRFEDGDGAKVVNSVDGAGEGSHNASYTKETPCSKIPLTGEDNKLGLEFKGNEVAALRMPFVFHQGMGDGTLEFWVKAPKGECNLFWSSPANADTNRFHIFVSSGWLICGYRDPAGGGHVLLLPENDFKVPANTWTHIAITRSGKTYRFYKNGIAAHTVTDPNPNLPTTVGWRMGGGLHGHPAFAGWIDEMRVSNKALLPSEFLNAPHLKK